MCVQVIKSQSYSNILRQKLLVFLFWRKLKQERANFLSVDLYNSWLHEILKDTIQSYSSFDWRNVIHSEPDPWDATSATSLM